MYILYKIVQLSPLLFSTTDTTVLMKNWFEVVKERRNYQIELSIYHKEYFRHEDKRTEERNTCPSCQKIIFPPELIQALKSNNSEYLIDKKDKDKFLVWIDKTICQRRPDFYDLCKLLRLKVSVKNIDISRKNKERETIENDVPYLPIEYAKVTIDDHSLLELLAGNQFSVTEFSHYTPSPFNDGWSLKTAYYFPEWQIHNPTMTLTEMFIKKIKSLYFAVECLKKNYISLKEESNRINQIRLKSNYCLVELGRKDYKLMYDASLQNLKFDFYPILSNSFYNLFYFNYKFHLDKRYKNNVTVHERIGHFSNDTRWQDNIRQIYSEAQRTKNEHNN